MKKLVILLAALVLLAGGANGSFIVDALTPAQAVEIQPADDNGGGGQGCYAGVYWHHTYNTGQLVADHSNPGWIKYYWVYYIWGCENGTRYEGSYLVPAW
jgi:hypothetical protein